MFPGRPMQQHLPSVQQCRRVALAHLLAPSPIILRSLFLLFSDCPFLFFWLYFLLANERRRAWAFCFCALRSWTKHYTRQAFFYSNFHPGRAHVFFTPQKTKPKRKSKISCNPILIRFSPSLTPSASACLPPSLSLSPPASFLVSTHVRPGDDDIFRTALFPQLSVVSRNRELQQTPTYPK